MKSTPRAKRYYGTLELSCDASVEEVREAYYRLAFTHHPDRNPGDASAAARFKEIQAAYEWLSHPLPESPSSSAEQFPFVARERTKARLVSRSLAAVAAVAAVAVTMTMLIRGTPRMGADLDTKNPQLGQIPSADHFATEHPRQVNIPSEEFTVARGSLIVKGRPEGLAESSAGSLLESVGWSSPKSFASTLKAARDAICRGAFSPVSLSEDWHDNTSWQGTPNLMLSLDQMSITGAYIELPPLQAQHKNDQQVLIEGGMIRFGHKSREPTALEPGLTLSALPSEAMELKPDNDTASKWSGESQSSLFQQPQTIEYSMPQSYEIGSSSDAWQHPSRNRHSLSPELLSNATISNHKDQSKTALLNPLERFSSAPSKDAMQPSTRFPGQPKAGPARQEAKLPGHSALHQTKHEQRSPDRPQRSAVDISNWGAKLKQKAPQSGVPAGNLWGSGANSIRGVEWDSSVSGRGGAMANLGWNSKQASATSPNYAGLATRSDERMDKSFLSPTASKAAASRGPYLEFPSLPSQRTALPAMTPYGSAIRTNDADRDQLAWPLSGP